MFDESDIIYRYTSEEAVQDGVLVDLDQIFPGNEKTNLFKYATTNLMNQGFLEKDEIKKAAIQDLLVQASAIAKAKSKGFTKPDWFYSGEIELPNGSKQEIFIEQNETGRYTVMLPEDH